MKQGFSDMTVSILCSVYVKKRLSSHVSGNIMTLYISILVCIVCCSSRLYQLFTKLILVINIVFVYLVLRLALLK